MAKTGVVALMMEASPLPMKVCPQKINVKGTRLFSSPMPKKARHRPIPAGTGMPRSRR